MLHAFFFIILFISYGPCVWIKPDDDDDDDDNDDEWCTLCVMTSGVTW